jgi:hypothetical protein
MLEAKAKFYFQLGLAQAGIGQTADACAFFQNSMYGPFAEPSKAQRTNLTMPIFFSDYFRVVLL